jgi:hypothetical protein
MDLNHKPSAYKTAARTIELYALNLAPPERLELPTSTFVAWRYYPVELRRYKFNISNNF